MFRSRFSLALDWLALALVVAAAIIFLTGGAVVFLWGLRITARSADRALLAALAVVLLRAALDRTTPPLANLPAVAARIRDFFYHPLADVPLPLSDGRVWQRRALAALAFGAFAVVLLFPQLRHLDYVPDIGDPLFSMWRIGWLFHKLQGDPRPLFSPNIFHPFPYTLTFSDSMLLPSATTLPLLVIGLHPVVAYNIALVASFAASALAMYVLVERLTGSPAAAFISGLLFGFYPYRFEHYSHFELQMTYCIPLALLVLHRMMTYGRVRDGVWLGLLAAAQLYSSMYYAVFFVFYAATAFAVLWVVGRPPWRRLVAPSIVAAVLALLLAWPLAHVYSSANLGEREIAAVKYYSATVSDYFRAHDRSAMWGDRMLSGRQPERALFPGFMVLVLGAIALVPPLGKTRLVHVAAGFVLFEISIGLNGFIYKSLYDGFGFVRGLRVPARASIFVGMALALLAGFAVRKMVAARPRWTAAIVTALAVLIAIDLHPLLKLEPVWPQPPPIYGSVAGSHDVVLAEFPYGGSRRFTSNVPFMYFSLWHWADMVNGYSGHVPDGQYEFEQGLRGFPDPQSLALLRSRGATHVTVNCGLYRGGCEELLQTIAGVPELHLVASGRWQGQPVQLYELRR